MIRPLFAFEDVVLYVFVVVRSYFVWVFSSVCSRAMDVPGVSNVLRPLSIPSLAAGSTSSPPEPADVAPPPRLSGANITVISIPSVVLEDTAVPDTSVDVQPILVSP
ncbi:unnamed protein product, partial [Ectocarpus sp. 4 AP-2014]